MREHKAGSVKGDPTPPTMCPRLGMQVSAGSSVGPWSWAGGLKPHGPHSVQSGAEGGSSSVHPDRKLVGRLFSGQT